MWMLYSKFQTQSQKAPTNMAKKRTVLISWSSGKDSAWMLHRLRQDPTVQLAGLLTTVNEHFDRVAMHAVRCDVLEAQAEAAGLPLFQIPIPWPCSNKAYEAAMQRAVDDALELGVTHMAFGDLFLEDVRDYRIDKLAGTGIEPLFPVWGLPTDQLARDIVDAGVETYITCVDPKQLDRAFAGRRFDHALLAEFAEGVDPCGENGEFHTCVLAGPQFDHSIAASVGEVVERDGFIFADLVLNQES